MGKTKVERRIELLLPAFVPKVLALLDAMREQGFRPRVHETYRSPERCAELQATKKSRNGLGSMHRYRAAVDIIDDVLLWSNPRFFVTLGREALKLRLTWGGDWDSNPATDQDFDDRPHIQAIPLGKQNAFRLLTSDEARNAFLVDFFARQRSAN